MSGSSRSGRRNGSSWRCHASRGRTKSEDDACGGGAIVIEYNTHPFAFPEWPRQRIYPGSLPEGGAKDPGYLLTQIPGTRTGGDGA